MQNGESTKQLISYIAPSAPATRRPAVGDEPFLRPEFGFTPNWYHDALKIDFGERWHNDPEYRRKTIIAMGRELKRRFNGIPVGNIENPDEPEDLLTGTFGTCIVASIYGVPVSYAHDNWPASANKYLTSEQLDTLSPPDLDSNEFFSGLLNQVDWIERNHGKVSGYLNWQGVLNNAHRLRGQELFIDMIQEPERMRHLFNCVCTTMIDAAERLYDRQRTSGFEVNHFTVSNCLVNMISPEQYRDMLLPYDKKIAEKFKLIGVHNCAWNADPWLDCYAAMPGLGYIDMGIESNLVKAKEVFPDARRAVMYTPMDVKNKSLENIRQDLERIARGYGPCDVVFADIDDSTADEKIKEIFNVCMEISG